MSSINPEMVKATNAISANLEGKSGEVLLDLPSDVKKFMVIKVLDELVECGIVASWRRPDVDNIYVTLPEVKDE